MACFLVGAAEAVVVTSASKIVKNNEMKRESIELEKKAAAEVKSDQKLPWSKKLMIFAQMLWGGVFLLCFEHVWHGEVVPWFPFLTAMNDPGDTADMLAEMGSIGVLMIVIVTVAWALMMFAADKILSRPADAVSSAA